MFDLCVRRFFTSMVVAVAVFGWTGELAAQPYPVRPITMIVPFPAGGATDTLARFLAEKMREVLGQPIIIENVGGAAGTIGVGRAVRSAADGYTLSIGTSTTHMLTGGLYTLPFDLLTDSQASHLYRRRTAAARGAERFSRQRSQGADRLSQGQPRQGLGRYRRRRRGRASCRHRVPETDRDEIPVRALSRQCAGDAGPVGGADRFHDGAVVQFQIADCNRQHQADCGHRQNAAAGIAHYSDRSRKPACPGLRPRSGTGSGCRKIRRRTSSRSSTPPCGACSPIPW